MVQKNDAHYGIIVSEFYPDIAKALLEGTLARLQEWGISRESVTVVSVPGAVEIPFVANRLAQLQQCTILICLGAVIRGETDHYTYVCEQVSRGCQQVMFDWDIPVIFGILTTLNRRQAKDRVGGKVGNKGIEAANTAVYMVNLIQQFRIKKN